jgi:hypothetical protein
VSRYVLALLFLLLAACGERQRDLSSARSASATALAVAGQWSRGEVSTVYARDRLRIAAEELKRGPLPHAAAPVDELVEAIGREDRAAVQRLVQELSSAGLPGAR